MVGQSKGCIEEALPVCWLQVNLIVLVTVMTFRYIDTVIWCIDIIVTVSIAIYQYYYLYCCSSVLFCTVEFDFSYSTSQRFIMPNIFLASATVKVEDRYTKRQRPLQAELALLPLTKTLMIVTVVLVSPIAILTIATDSRSSLYSTLCLP